MFWLHSVKYTVGVTCLWLHSVTYTAGRHVFVVTFNDIHRWGSHVPGYIQ